MSNGNIRISVISLVMISAFMLVSCKGRYEIYGQVESFGFDGKILTVNDFSSGEPVVIDSCTVSHGHFSMKGRTKGAKFVMLCRDGIPVLPMYLEKGKSDIMLVPTGMKAAGTRQNDLLYGFLEKKRAIDNRYEDTWQKRMQLVRSGSMDQAQMEVIQDSLKAIVSECEELIYSFISANYREKAAAGVFAMLIQGPSNDIPPFVKRILDDAPSKFLENRSVAEYIEKTGYTRP